MNRPPNTAKAQAGVMLLEALIGILIFSLGILSLVALQATSIQLTSDAKYRTDASLLANRLIGQMWASGLAPAVLKTKFENGGDEYNTWLTSVQGNDEIPPGLPGVVAASSGVDSTLPVVNVFNDGRVEITLFWRTPQMATSGANSSHRHQVFSQIVRNP
jgi:type IV pilus assembly protein PilV